jgi:hypothetical protein
MNWKSFLKVAIAGTLSGAMSGAVDAVSQGGITDPAQIKKTVIAGAVMGAIGYWMKSPRQLETPKPQVPPKV